MANDRTTKSSTSNSGAPQPISVAQESPSGEGEPAPESEGKQPAGTRALKGVSAPLWWIEKRGLEPIATWLSNLAFLQILEYLGKLAIVVAVITWIAQSGAREREANYEAWRVINSAQGQEGSGGRVEAIENLYRGEESLVGLSAADAFLANIDLYEEDIGGADLDSANLQKADLGGADLHEASLWRAVLRGSYLAKDPVTGTASDLGGADLSNSDLRESDLTKANLAGANLYFANLTEATLAGADLQGAKLWQSTFVDASLRNADLRNTDFGDYANLQGAVLVGADLRGAKLGGVSLLQIEREWRRLSRDEGAYSGDD